MTANGIAYIQLVLRLTLGLIFLVSAVTKLRDMDAFLHGVEEYAVLSRPLATLYGRLLPFTELIAALLLLSGILVGLGTALIVLMLVSFAVAITINAIRGRAPACHCFGESSSSRVGWHTLIRNLALLLPAGTLFWLYQMVQPTNTLTGPNLFPIFGIAVMVALVYMLAVESLELLTRYRSSD